MNKSYRQEQILKLIRSRHVHTQEELAAELRRVGVSATQVTLSRDMRELGLLKTPQGYVPNASTAPAGPDFAAVAREFLTDVRIAQNILVLRTLPAHADMLAAALDHADWPEVTGTVAGDDTVLVVSPDSDMAQAARGKLLKFLK